MFKLLIKIFIMLLLVAASCYLIIILTPMAKDHYLRAYGQKQEMLKSTHPPRIIFVGGSGVAWGINSEKVSQVFTDYTILNMGMNSPQGLRFMLENLKPWIKKGDVVVVIPEYQHFYGLLNGSTDLFALIEIYPETIKYIKLDQLYFLMSETFPQYLQIHGRRLLDKILGNAEKAHRDVDRGKAGDFNRYGDYLGHLGMKPTMDITTWPFFLPSEDTVYNDKAIKVLNSFEEYAEKKGVAVYYIFPALSKFHFRQGLKYIEKVHEELTRKSEVPLLNEPADYTMPVELFFNRRYHPTDVGREIYTENIINSLKKRIPSDTLLVSRQ